MVKCPQCDIPLKTFCNDNKLLGKCVVCGFVQPKNYMTIDSIYAFVSVDPTDNNEGVIAFQSEKGPMPMIAADPDRLSSLRPIASMMASRSGIKVRLLKFSQREEIEEFG